MKRICPICKELFIKRQGNYIYCNIKCSNKARNAKFKTYKKEWTQKKREDKDYREQERLRAKLKFTNIPPKNKFDKITMRPQNLGKLYKDYVRIEKEKHGL